MSSVRYVCLDLGGKRTGVAVGDTITRVVTPVNVLDVPSDAQGGGPAGSEYLGSLAAAVREHLGDPPAPGEIVLGLPLNMDGSEGPGAKAVRALGARLAALAGRVVHFQDERLTSVDADWAMARSGLTHGQKKKRRDALAAAAILRDFVEAAQPRPGGRADST
ncbi:MAG: Holliday junction resolvase RuvX [Phycisphaerales bacterium]|nr:Holliday junction resolvase RuvX [Phycisphaerales bacterium]